MKSGDVILLSDGRIFAVVDVANFNKPTMCVQFIDRNECSYVDPDNFDIEKNLGQSNEVLAYFHSMRGVHLRLNRMSKI